MTRLRLRYRPSQVDYLLVLLLVAISGNQAFTTGARQDVVLLGAFLIILLRMIKLQRVLESRSFLIVVSIYLMIFLFQTLSLHYFAAVTIAGFFFKLVIGAGVIGTVRYFRLAYVRVMVWLATLSLLFHLSSVVAAAVGIRLYEVFRPLSALIGAEASGVNERINVLLHSFMGGEELYRNAGMFWEPGAFSGYLILALVLLATIATDLPAPVLRRWRAILVVTELTTLSTTGYVFLPLALMTFRIVATERTRNGLNRLAILTLLPLLLLPMALALWQLDFVGSKIVGLYERAVFQEAGWQVSRFGAVIFDWAYIQIRPLFGWGQSLATQFSLHPDLERFATGNGLTGYARQLGLCGLLVFLSGFWIGLGRLGVTGISRIFVFAIAVLQLNGEFFLSYPLYAGLQCLALERNPATEAARAGRQRKGLYLPMGRRQPATARMMGGGSVT
ncbi:hypothetical protein [Pseudodonghicola flavimaris]|uniref:O-antigen ligase domain-containing protein n=1 Tax=Pseudodonghicola flavimaris TaxID=3050036 RepID=A0ABT7F3A7_9RHOB|nr:hypothetical protein [Pseudodonghicola flavimaris]MDK3019096.1 hypothetical protein [Pseudodonghicola flavimaris]